MGKICLKVGDRLSFARTFTETDVYRFAGIVGDMSPYHIDEEFCKTTPLKTRTVQPCLVFSLANALSGEMGVKAGRTTLGIGFDSIRFLKTVSFGDTVTAVFTVSVVDEERMRVYCDCVMYDQNGDTVVTGVNIIKVVEPYAV